MTLRKIVGSALLAAPFVALLVAVGITQGWQALAPTVIMAAAVGCISLGAWLVVE